jgi:Tol biopolymer transport system component
MFSPSHRRGFLRFLAPAGAILLAGAFTFWADARDNGPRTQPAGASPEMLTQLKHYKAKIVYESHRDGNWELYLMNADGSNPVNLTNTPDVDEMYAKPSPNGRMICFEADEGKGAARVRNLYVINSDGTGRHKIADNARDPSWSPDGKQIAYLGGEFKRFSYRDFATKGLFIYDLKTGATHQHPNKKLMHLYYLKWAPGGKWFVATVHGGMGFRHSIVAIQADGDKVVDLHLGGCRPDVSPDGKHIAWGHGDFCAGVADLDLTLSTPRATNIRNAVESPKPIETYHMCWSPNGRYIAFSRGPHLKHPNLRGLLPEFPGVDAPGWNICVCDAFQHNKWVELTSDGQSNKQPGWVIVDEEARK